MPVGIQQTNLPDETQYGIIGNPRGKYTHRHYLTILAGYKDKPVTRTYR